MPDDPKGTFEYKDIGSKILSFLTKGIYPDPRDPIREYIQNAVDAGADGVYVSVHSDTVYVENSGNGLDEDSLRDLRRIGISDKDPHKNVGHKGIGIYSAFHIADELEINSIKEGESYQFHVDFKVMRRLIDQSEELPNIINEASSISKTTSFEFKSEGMKEIKTEGTQIVLKGIHESVLDNYKNEEFTSYIEKVIPLNFHPDFPFGEEIQQNINQVCDKHGHRYKTVTLHLAVDEIFSREVYRPYVASDDLKFLQPEYEGIYVDVKGKPELFGYIWGCANSDIERLDKNLDWRGFLLKHHGFTIGDSNTARTYFKNGDRQFARYVGEIIILSTRIQVNAPRNDIEISEYSQSFKTALEIAAEKFYQRGEVRQESKKAIELAKETRKLLVEVSKKPTEEGHEELLGNLDALKDRKKKKPLNEDAQAEVDQCIKQVEVSKDVIAANIEDPSKEIGSIIEDLLDIDKSEVVEEPAAEIANEPIPTPLNINPSPSAQNSFFGSQKRSQGFKRNIEAKKILDALTIHGNHAPPEARKLADLYESLCKLGIDSNPVLAFIGVWCFWEVLGKALLKDNDKDSYGHLRSKLKYKFEISSRKNKDYANKRLALEYIQEHGNSMKHAYDFFHEETKNLRNCMEVLDDFLVIALKDLYKNLTNEDWQG